MNRVEMELLVEIMETSFTLVETTLYLDTHPDDERALMLHNNMSQKYHDLVSMYEARYGLLTYTGMSGLPWNYIDGPWPWEINFTNI